MTRGPWLAVFACFTTAWVQPGPRRAAPRPLAAAPASPGGARALGAAAWYAPGLAVGARACAAAARGGAAPWLPAAGLVACGHLARVTVGDAAARARAAERFRARPLAYAAATPLAAAFVGWFTRVARVRRAAAARDPAPAQELGRRADALLPARVAGRAGPGAARAPRAARVRPRRRGGRLAAAVRPPARLAGRRARQGAAHGPGPRRRRRRRRRPRVGPRGHQLFNPTSMCASSNGSRRTLWPCFENPMRAIDSSKHQPNRLRFDRARESQSLVGTSRTGGRFPRRCRSRARCGGSTRGGSRARCRRPSSAASSATRSATSGPARRPRGSRAAAGAARRRGAARRSTRRRARSRSASRATSGAAPRGKRASRRDFDARVERPPRGDEPRARRPKRARRDRARAVRGRAGIPPPPPRARATRRAPRRRHGAEGLDLEALCVRELAGGTRERNSQLRRLLSRPFSTRFG